MTAIGAKQNNLKWYKGKSIGDGFLWGKNSKEQNVSLVGDLLSMKINLIASVAIWKTAVMHLQTNCWLNGARLADTCHTNSNKRTPIFTKPLKIVRW